MTMSLGAVFPSIAVVTRFVDDDAEDGGDGSTWTLAFNHLEDAIDASSNGDSIFVGQGKYLPTDGTDRTISFELKAGVKIFGGYGGLIETDPDAHNVLLFETVLSGNIGEAETGDDSLHVVVSLNPDSDVETWLDGFTIKAGFADPDSSFPAVDPEPDFARVGAGLFVRYGNPSIRNCVFMDNHADEFGGAIAAVDNDLPIEIRNCKIHANSANDSGGGIYLDTAALVINSEIKLNTAASGGGGGIALSRGSADVLSLKVINCRITLNSSVGSGGGILMSTTVPAATAELVHCLVANMTRRTAAVGSAAPTSTTP